MPRSPWLYLILGLGVVAVSTAAPLIRTAAAPPLSIAAYRMLLAGAPSLALAAWRKRAELRSLSRVEWVFLVLSGLSLAAHFATWVASLKYGTVASSVALVTTSPFFVAALAFAVSRERTPRRTLLAIGVCGIGGLVIGAADVRAGGGELFGDGLALAGAAFAAAYYVLGRRVRVRISLLGYIGVIYPVAALALLAAAATARQPLAGFSARTYVVFALLALVPQLLGHSALNWALAYVSAPFVAISVLGEPILATALAAVFLREWPGPERIAGGLLILAGVYLALREEMATVADKRAALLPADAG